MTTIPFTPNNSASPPFQAVVTLDGSSYSISTMWNSYRSDWYIQLRDQSGNLLVNQPLIGSPPSSDIPLFPDTLTTSTILYRVATQQFEITP